MTAHIEACSAYIHEMMMRLGIGRDAGDSPQMCLWLETAFERCDSCETKKACQDWLNCAPSSVSVAPWFCRNGELLFELQYDRPGPRRAH